ncbi:MAG: hypothetical protein AAGF53_01320, partial [Pseudomonadota bacterium]
IVIETTNSLTTRRARASMATPNNREVVFRVKCVTLLLRGTTTEKLHIRGLLVLSVDKHDI